jgi:hypothetical protein
VKRFVDDGAVHPWLLTLLTAAVHRDLDEVRGMPAEQRQREAARLVDVIAGGGDRLLRWQAVPGGKRAREEFNEVWTGTVRALAIAAMLPGGVTFCGVRLDAEWTATEPVQHASTEELRGIVAHLCDVWDLSLRTPPAEGAT